MTNCNYITDKKLTKTVLRMPKDFTSFFYFTMESNENIGFYSTLPFEKGQAHRDIVVYTTPELHPDFQNILKHCGKRQELEILEKALIDD